jgi:hypothetical protein
MPTGSEELLQADSGIVRTDERVPPELPLKLFPILRMNQLVHRLVD